MATETRLLLLLITAFILLALSTTTTFAAVDIGVNWGTQASHPLDPSIVVKMLKANGIKKVKLFDADEWTMNALAGSGLEVMIGIPNFDLGRMSEKLKHAEAWVKENVTAYDHDGGVNIKYVAVGNEAFLTSYNGVYLKTTLPAMKNVQRALIDAGVGDRIKVVTPLNSDVYGSPPHDPVPSAGDFRSDIHSLMLDVVKFLHQNQSPFVVNIYPFLSLQQNKDFPVDFAFFDGGNRSIDDKGKQYENVFDANYDTLTWALKKAGVGDMKIVVGEAGWPTDGDENANVEKAKRFYDGFLKKLASKKGTPLRPGEDMDVYLFGLLDENMKSILPGNFERHWGLFRYDGQPKFPLDLSLSSHPKLPIAAKGVEYLPAQWCILNPESNPDPDHLAASLDYACSRADCTPLEAGGSCQSLGRSKYVSYAFNVYFQMQDQDVRACDFGGQAKIVTANASVPGCLFPVEIVSRGERVMAGFLAAVAAVVGVVIVLV